MLWNLHWFFFSKIIRFYVVFIRYCRGFELMESVVPTMFGVDFRVLKAVAIENSNDLDAAVNDVLNEVLPFLTKHPESPAKVQTPSSQPTAGIL
ncbi:hypothetical protein RchiOBHm_Chr6g0290811 [Rosa chinensis]|uniref:Uncharacterized protein n=1 Tax=Rosa chinensis TaxID=74649 RepID=A0A2P6PVY5_ROSCH|nr:hypothetical protein RchiOBHm_Chr6g0290811 [Rosa chinensis]